MDSLRGIDCPPTKAPENAKHLETCRRYTTWRVRTRTATARLFIDNNNKYIRKWSVCFFEENAYGRYAGNGRVGGARTQRFRRLHEYLRFYFVILLFVIYVRLWGSDRTVQVYVRTWYYSQFGMGYSPRIDDNISRCFVFINQITAKGCLNGYRLARFFGPRKSGTGKIHCVMLGSNQARARRRPKSCYK